MHSNKGSTKCKPHRNSCKTTKLHDHLPSRFTSKLLQSTSQNSHPTGLHYETNPGRKTNLNQSPHLISPAFQTENRRDRQIYSPSLGETSGADENPRDWLSKVFLMENLEFLLYFSHSRWCWLSFAVDLQRFYSSIYCFRPTGYKAPSSREAGIEPWRLAQSLKSGEHGTTWGKPAKRWVGEKKKT